MGLSCRFETGIFTITGDGKNLAVVSIWWLKSELLLRLTLCAASQNGDDTLEMPLPKDIALASKNLLFVLSERRDIIAVGPVMVRHTKTRDLHLLWLQHGSLARAGRF